MGTPLFTGDIFQWARFCNVNLQIYIMITLLFYQILYEELMFTYM